MICRLGLSVFEMLHQVQPENSKTSSLLSSTRSKRRRDMAYRKLVLGHEVRGNIHTGLDFAWMLQAIGVVNGTSGAADCELFAILLTVDVIPISVYKSVFTLVGLIPKLRLGESVESATAT